MSRRKYIFIGSAVILSINFILLTIIITINQVNLKPSNDEIILLQKAFGSLIIKNKRDLLSIHNKVVREIKHEFNGRDEIVIKDILSAKKGLCYDRSLILQKILILNKIPIRPVFVFFNTHKKSTSWFDFFSTDIDSHNLFEFEFYNKWYVLKINTTMAEFQTLEKFISSNWPVPSHSKFVRYLNNRNSRFISPSFIPDIYFY